MTQAQIKAMHAGGHAPTPAAPPPGRVVALSTPPTPAVRETPKAMELTPPEPMDIDAASTEDIDALGDALVLLAMSAGGDSVSVRQAAQEVSRRRSIPIEHARRIVDAARAEMVAVGKKRKALDPDTAAALIGETRLRFMAIFKTSMSKENFGKGGAGAAVKAAQAIAVIDGCPVDGMSPVAVHIHMPDSGGVVIDPEREAIARAILARVRPQRVIEVAADG